MKYKKFIDDYSKLPATKQIVVLNKFAEATKHKAIMTFANSQFVKTA